MAASGHILAVADLRDHALEPNRAGMLIHLAAVDLEAFAELDIRSGDDFLEQSLMLEQWQFSKFVTVEIEQVERDHHDFGRLILQLILKHREIGSPIRHDDFRRR